MRKIKWAYMVMVVVELLILAIPVRADEDAAVVAIRKLGGQVNRDDKRPEKPVVAVRFGPTNDISLWNDVVSKRTREDRRSARGLDKVTDSVMKEIAQLKNLQSLNVAGTAVTDVGLKELAQFPKLEALGLAGTDITDAGLINIKSLRFLKALNLADTQITDAGLKVLKELPDLQFLNIANTKITDGGLAHLKELKTLWWLKLDRTAVTDVGLKELRPVKSLRILTLIETKVTYAGVEMLTENKSSLSVFRAEGFEYFWHAPDELLLTPGDWYNSLLYSPRLQKRYEHPRPDLILPLPALPKGVTWEDRPSYRYGGAIIDLTIPNKPQ